MTTFELGKNILASDQAVTLSVLADCNTRLWAAFKLGQSSEGWEETTNIFKGENVVFKENTEAI